MATIGYLEGVDSLLLTRLAAQGVGTLPISNGFDNHGKFINALTERDEVTLILGYLHKFLRTQKQGFLAEDILDACFTHHIQVMVIVPEADQDAARKLLGKAGEYVILVAPEHAYQESAARLLA